MNARLHTAVLSTALVLAALATAANAEQRIAPLSITPDLPSMGFTYRLTYSGYLIQGVRWGTPAAQMGLEPGDVVLSANGYRLNYYGAHWNAIREACMGDGYVTMRVRDVRTGMVVTRSAFVGAYGVAGSVAGAPAYGRSR